MPDQPAPAPLGPLDDFEMPRDIRPDPEPDVVFRDGEVIVTYQVASNVGLVDVLVSMDADAPQVLIYASVVRAEDDTYRVWDTTLGGPAPERWALQAHIGALATLWLSGTPPLTPPLPHLPGG